MGAKPLLLKNGVVIVHQADDTAKGIKADVLIKGNKIEQIRPEIAADVDVEVIDCTDKIIAPGFVDTHRHMYNIGLRGRHGDHLLTDYIAQGILQASSFETDEIFWGQLAGCLESISAGTTTVVDHSHLNYSEDKPKAAIAATVASGIRSVYGYCFNGRVDSWSPFAMNGSFIAPWATEALEKLATQAPFGDGRVQLGVAFDGWFLPKEMLVPLFEKVKKLGINHVTSHTSAAPPGYPSSVETMEACGILSSEVILSHANHLSATDISLIKKRNAHISSTPSLELQMAMGVPACFDPDRDLQGSSSLGIDCHSVTMASIPAEMRVALQSSRGAQNAQFLAQGKMPAKVYKTVQEAYALGTIAGARAVGMQDQIGSLAEGKLADIIVLDALSPAMICGAQYDPVTAIVLHSSPGDVVMTIVDGVVRKIDGKLAPVTFSEEVERLYAPAKRDSATTSLQWSDVSKHVLRTRGTLQAKLDKIDLVAAKTPAMVAFGFNPANVVESV